MKAEPYRIKINGEIIIRNVVIQSGHRGQLGWVNYKGGKFPIIMGNNPTEQNNYHFEAAYDHQ